MGSEGGWGSCLIVSVLSNQIAQPRSLATVMTSYGPNRRTDWLADGRTDGWMDGWTRQKTWWLPIIMRTMGLLFGCYFSKNVTLVNGGDSGGGGGGLVPACLSLIDWGEVLGAGGGVRGVGRVGSVFPVGGWTADSQEFGN